MSNIKISQLPAAVSLNGNEAVPISVSGETRRTTVQAIADLAGSGGGAVSSVAGRTGDITLTKSDVGLGSVDNTADASKPVSTAQATADAAVQAFAIQRANHTGSQAATTITQDSTHRFVTDTEKTTWNAGGGGASLPSMTGNAGKVLFTDGTAASWVGVNGLVVSGLQSGIGHSVANAAAIQATHDVCHVLGLTMLIPAGTWQTETINWNGQVRIMGAGRMRSTLQSANPVPLIVADGNIEGAPNGIIIAENSEGISHLDLDGNNVGTIGLKLKLMAWFTLEHLTIRRFTVTGADMAGSLSYTVRNCVIGGCDYGFKIYAGQLTSGSYVGTNLISFYDCIFGGGAYGGCATWAVNCTYEGAMIKVSGCDFEFNGAPGVANSGAVYIGGMNDEGASVGYVTENTWYENNAGTVLWIDQSTRYTKHIIHNCFWGNAFNYLTLLRVSGDKNDVLVENCQIRYGLVADNYAPHPELVVENGARVKGRFNIVPTVKEINGGTYREYPDDTPRLNMQCGNGGLSFDAEILASNATYYNRMNGGASPIAPTVGTGNVIATGGLTLQDAYTPFPYDSAARSICINDNSKVLQVPLNIAGATTFAFAFWVYVNPGNADQILSSNWSGVGSFAWAKNQANRNTYIAMAGSAGTNDFVMDTTQEAGWYFYAVVGGAGGITSVYENGIRILTDTSNGSVNTLTDLTLNWGLGTRLGAFASWVDAAVPTQADFIRFYQSRYNA